MLKRIACGFAGFILFCCSTLAEEITVTHQLDTITIETNPQRVVVLGPGPLDAIDYFGIDPIGVFQLYMPNYLKHYEHERYLQLGTFFEPDYEAIYEAKPDLIIIGPRLSAKYDELKKIAPTLMFSANLDKDYWSSTQQQWQNLARIFSLETQVNEKIAELNQRLKSTSKFIQDKQYDALIVMTFGEHLSAFGAESRMSSVYSELGFNTPNTPVDASTHGQKISYEFIGEVDPDVLLVLSGEKLKNRSIEAQETSVNNDIVRATSAGKNNRIVYLDIDAWYQSIAGVTAMEVMLEDINSLR